jgi:nitric oxide reductase large subunit
MKSEEDYRQRRLFGIAIIAILVATLSFRLLLIVENSLSSGLGPGLSGNTSLQTIPLMLLIAILIVMLTLLFRSEPINFTIQDFRIATLLIAMFFIGMLIEPLIPIPTNLIEDDLFGLILLAMPLLIIIILLITFFNQQNISKNLYEEE